MRAKAIAAQMAAWVYWPPFFADSRDVAFDIAGIEIRRVEGWIEQLDELILAANEVLIHRFHGHAGALGISRAG